MRGAGACATASIHRASESGSAVSWPGPLVAEQRIFPQRNLFDVLDQPKRFIFVPPEVGGITARRDELATVVFFVNDVAAQVAQRRFEHIEDEFRPRRAA